LATGEDEVRTVLVRFWRCISFLALFVLLSAQLTEPRRIAFIAEHAPGLYTADYPSGRVHLLRTGLSNVAEPVFSAKAGLLAIEGARTHDAYRSLYLIRLADGKKDRIYDADATNFLVRPAFDPAGANLYAVSYSTGIFRYSLAKKRWSKVPVVGAADFHPQGLAFSKSGRRVALSLGSFKGLLLARVDGDTFVVEQELLVDFRNCLSPRWIGDRAILFDGRRQDDLQALWRLDLGSSSRPTQLTHPPITTRDFLSLSADESTVAFTAGDMREPLAWTLWVISPDGTGLRSLVPAGRALPDQISPAWIE
jgi:hypothetical protein